MIASTLIAAVGLGLGAVGTAVQVMGQQKAAAASERAEGLREQQMNLDATRTRRQIIRQSIAARSQALATATAQGGGEAGGSALPGAYAGITTSAARASTYNNQSQTIGGGIFQANADQAAGQGMSSFGSGLSGFGGTLVNNAPTISRLGTYYGGGAGATA